MVFKYILITSITTGTMCIHCIKLQKLTLNTVYCIGEGISVLWGWASIRTELPSWNFSSVRMLQTYKEGTSVLWGLPGPRLRCPHGTSVLGLKCHRVSQSRSTSVPFYQFQHAWTKSFLVQGWNSRCTSCKLGVVLTSHQPSMTSNWTWYSHQIWYPHQSL